MIQVTSILCVASRGPGRGQNASSVPNAGARRCWIPVPGATRVTTRGDKSQTSPTGNSASPMTQSPYCDSFHIWVYSIELFTKRGQFESIAQSFISLPDAKKISSSLGTVCPDWPRFEWNMTPISGGTGGMAILCLLPMVTGKTNDFDTDIYQLVTAEAMVTDTENSSLVNFSNRQLPRLH